MGIIQYWKKLDIRLLFLLGIILIIILILKKTNSGFNSKYGTERLDGVVYINLENRQDRKIVIEDEIKKMKIGENIVQKVAGVYKPKNGHKGCIQAHLLALRIAKMNHLERCLILEDDAELDVSSEEFQQKINIVSDFCDNNKWDVIMLSTANADKKNIDGHDHIKHIKYATLGTAYFVNNKYLDTLIDLYEDCNQKMGNEKWGNDDGHEPNALDQRWGDLQKKDKWYGLDKDLIKQRNIWSTTNNRGVH